MQKTCWLEEFSETCQAIFEDVVLLEALSAYVEDGGEADCFPQVFRRLCDYLSQHAQELHRLEERLEPDPAMRSGP